MSKRQFYIAMAAFMIFFVGLEIKIALVQRETMRHLDNINATIDEIDKDMAAIHTSLDPILDGGE